MLEHPTETTNLATACSHNAQETWHVTYEISVPTSLQTDGSSHPFPVAVDKTLAGVYECFRFYHISLPFY